MDVLARPEYQIVGPLRCSRWCLLKFIAHTSRGETPARAPFPCGQIARRSDKCLVLSVTVYPNTSVPRNRNQEGPFCNIRRFATAKIFRFCGFESTRSSDPVQRSQDIVKLRLAISGSNDISSLTVNIDTFNHVTYVRQLQQDLYCIGSYLYFKSIFLYAINIT